MTVRLTPILIALAVLGAPAAAENREIDDRGRTGYSLGHQIGEDLRRSGREIDSDSMSRGLHDGLDGAEPSISPDDMKSILLALKRDIESGAEEEIAHEGDLTQRGLNAVLPDDAKGLGYSIGYQVGGDFRRQGLDLDPDMVVRGVQDAVAGSESLMTTAEMQQTLKALNVQVVKSEALETLQRGQTAREGGADFFAENAQREGVVSLESGLQYRVLAEGDGASPGPGDTVTVHYRGRQIDGTEFDSSYARGEPATFRLDRAIPGWTEGLQLMNEGAKYELFVPPELAYDRGRLAGQVLIFEIELLEVEPGSGRESFASDEKE